MNKYFQDLEYREALIYWRENPSLLWESALHIWNRDHAGMFRMKLEEGWRPDLVTGFFERLPLSGLRLRWPALRHDIRYGEGGTEADRLFADKEIREDIIRFNSNTLYARMWAAIIYRVTRVFGKRKRRFHFHSRPKPSLASSPS